MSANFKRLITKKVSDAIRNCGEGIPSIPGNIVPEPYISSVKNNNFNFNLPLKSFKNHKNYNNILSKIFSIEPNDTIEKIYNNGNKEVVFSINRNEFIRNTLININSLEKKSKILLNCSKTEKILLEYSSPNIAKPFHLGHLRSTIIGNFVANLLEFIGHDVVRINYLGDWGTQFGLLSLGLKFADISEESIEKDPIDVLYTVYVQANKMASEDPSVAAQAREIFFRLEEVATNDISDKSKNAMELNQWEKIRTYTEKELKEMYGRLGVEFDEYAWESEFRASKIFPLLNKMENIGLLQMDNTGKKVINVEGFKNPVPLVKSDGSTLYLTRDVACALDRYKRYNFDRLYYVVDNSQSDHFRALFSILKRLGFPQQNKEINFPAVTHLKFGRVRGMSTRKGTAVFLKNILDEAQAITKEKLLNSSTTKISKKLSDKTADILGTSAVIINDLKQRRQKDYNFDWNHILQMEGDSGIRLQYTHSRLCNLERNSGLKLPLFCDPSALPEPEVTHLVREIARFEDALMKSYEELEACHLVTYLFQLCNHINRAFKVLQVKDQSEVGSQRLLLFHISRITLGQGMKILGLRPLENM